MRFNLLKGSAGDHQEVSPASIIHELLWFLDGETSIAYLKENGVSIWDEWADGAGGDLGPGLRLASGAPGRR